MLIWRCDLCGEETSLHGFISSQFKNQDWRELTAVFRPRPDVHDVCPKCYEKIESAWREAKDEEGESRDARYLQKLGSILTG